MRTIHMRHPGDSECWLAPIPETRKNNSARIHYPQSDVRSIVDGHLGRRVAKIIGLSLVSIVFLLIAIGLDLWLMIREGSRRRDISAMLFKRGLLLVFIIVMCLHANKAANDAHDLSAVDSEGRPRGMKMVSQALINSLFSVHITTTIFDCKCGPFLAELAQDERLWFSRQLYPLFLPPLLSRSDQVPPPTCIPPSPNSCAASTSSKSSQ